MSLLTPRRLNPADYKGAGSWASNLIQVLNLREEGLLDLINGRLSVGDNVNGQVTTVSFTTPSNYATGGFTATSFVYNGNGASCCLIGSITCTKPGGVITSPTSLQWSFNNNVSPPSIQINYVAGLAAGQSYSMTVLVL
jgi:hypothetical protein